MGSVAEIREPTTGTEKHQQVEVEEEDEQVFELERKTSSFRPGKGPDSTEGSTITTTNTSSSSSFSGDGMEGIPDFHNGEGEHSAIENLEVPELPEKETAIGLHDEHTDGNISNVYFDGEQSAESAGAKRDAHESQTADRLNKELKLSVTENSSTSEDNKGSREIEEEQDGDLSKQLDPIDQPTGDVIEEELEIGEVEDYDVENVLNNQETHDLFCPNCNSCITKRVVLKKRKRNLLHVLKDPKRVRGPHVNESHVHSEDNLPSEDGGQSSVPESFLFKCLSCFSIFKPTGFSSKPLLRSEDVERLNTQPKPQKIATGESNWFSSIFGSNKEGSPVQKVPSGAMSSVPEANRPRDNEANPQPDNLSLSGEDTTGFTANIPFKAPTLVQGGAATTIQDGSEISTSQDKKPVDTPLIQDASPHDTSKVVNNGATVEEEQISLAQQKIDKDGSRPADVNQTSDNGRLSPIQPSHDLNILNKVTTGPGGVRVETVFLTEGASHLFEETDTSDTRNTESGITKVTGVMDTGDRGVITSSPSPEIDTLPVSSLEEGTLTLKEPLLRPVVEGRKVEILKSIVYGGLVESITSLGVISAAAGSGASTLNILVLGLANLFGGLILIIHKLQELREEEPRGTTTQDNQTIGEVVEGRYKRLLGRRENFTLHASVAILSFIIVGLVPPVVYYFSFSKTHNRDYKVASVFMSSLLFIVLMAIAKAHVKTPRGSYLKSILYYAMIAVSTSGISYVVGNFLDQLLEKYGWSDGSGTPAGHMMLSLMGRKAGSFGYSSSY